MKKANKKSMCVHIVSLHKASGLTSHVQMQHGVVPKRIYKDIAKSICVSKIS